MTKTITIDGKPVAFKASAAFLLKYANTFGRDALADLQQLDDLLVKGDFTGVIIMQRCLYVMAKSADPTVPDDMISWLDGFDDFPTMDIFSDLSDIFVSAVSGSKDEAPAEKKSTTKKKSPQQA